jgi:hypothetical protein
MCPLSETLPLAVASMDSERVAGFPSSASELKAESALTRKRLLCNARASGWANVRLDVRQK